MKEFFGIDGPLSKVVGGYVPREPQIDMAVAVDRALENGHHLVVEAPTGTGKSFAYLVPAIKQAVAHDKRVIVCTANIALQEQLINKDLPMLREVMDEDFTFALRKGLANYACRSLAGDLKRSMDKTKNGGDLDFLERPQGYANEEELERLMEWFKETRTGDKSELDFQPSGKSWSQMSSTPDDCLRECFYRNDCYGRKAQKECITATVTVCNYHVFFIAKQLEWDFGFEILGDYDAVIFDEAHKAADIARDFFGVQIKKSRFKHAVNYLDKLADSAAFINTQSSILENVDSFFTKLAKFGDSNDYKIRLKDPLTNRFNKEIRQLSLDLQIAADGYYAELKHIDLIHGEDKPEDVKTHFDNCTRRYKSCAKLMDEFDNAVNLSDERNVYFLEQDKWGCEIKSKRIFVKKEFENILDEVDTCIFTSATLSIKGEFKFFKEETAIKSFDGATGLMLCDELVVDTPFNYHSNVFLIAPNLPAPNEEEWLTEATWEFLNAVEATGGRTLGLFTSYRVLNHMHFAAKSSTRIPMHIQIMKQGEMPRTKLADMFREDVDSVLLGTESFWAGMDIPGESLSCVVIDKLPFPHFTDPVMDAIKENNSRWFFEAALPRAVVQFKQGFGRLIRRIDDYGVVVILDSRIVTKSYGSMFTASLPKVMSSRDTGKIRPFFEWKEKK